MKRITDFSELDLKKQYNYADYLSWHFSERVELIKGWIYKMPALPSGRTPAPKRRHQKIEGFLFVKLFQHLENSTCEVYQSPFDVRLIKNKQQEDKSIDTVVQPDICVICDKEKLDDAGCIGAPDLIIEILSLSTAKKDYNEKFNLYEENGVKEYWIVNPSENSIEIYSLKDGVYELYCLYGHTYTDETISGQLFPELKISLEKVFQN